MLRGKLLFLLALFPAGLVFGQDGSLRGYEVCCEREGQNLRDGELDAEVLVLLQKE